MWREQDSSTVLTSAVAYSLAAAEDRRKELMDEGAEVRIVEVEVGGPVPEGVLEEMRAGAASAAA